MIDANHLFLNFAKKLIIFRIGQKPDNIPRNNTNIDPVEQLLINCYLLVER